VEYSNPAADLTAEISRRESMEELLEACGIEQNEETEQQLLVFLTALKLFDNRNRTYRNIWETYGALSNLLRAATKVDREMEIWWHSPELDCLQHKEALDDAFDALNYLAFFIRCVRSGNITGSKRPRPVDPNGASATLTSMLEETT
jgi:hypothetical protein